MDYKKKVSIEEHCQEELDEYLNEFASHKLTNINKEL
jgi:hypothetical protein